MLNSFEITGNINESYRHNFMLEEDLYISYEHESIFNSVEQGNNKIVVYGYCFDVRNPQSDVRDTLSNLLNDQDNFFNNIKYLNGHYVILFNIESTWKLITDAVSITPVYIDAVNSIVSTEKSENLLSLHGLMILNLDDFSISRIELPTNKLTDERIERIILDLVINQYKYFVDKELTLNFIRNNMNKAIISTLYPALVNKTMSLRETDDLTVKIGKWLSRDYKMNLLDEDEESTTLYTANTHLMNFKFFNTKNSGLNDEQRALFNESYKLDNEFLKGRSDLEFNLLNKMRYRDEKKPHLIYDPFNVIAIQERVYGYSNSKEFNPLSRIIKIIHPSIDFYDFAEGLTLLQKYNQVKKKAEKLDKEIKKYRVNEKFLSDARTRDIVVSDNVDGTILKDGITFYPVSQKISKEDVYEVLYKKKGQGMVLIESYFDNPKNAHRIKVELNNELFNIDEFLEGKFIQADAEINIKMYYERNYDAASWQKAGKITVKEID